MVKMLSNGHVNYFNPIALQQDEACRWNKFEAACIYWNEVNRTSLSLRALNLCTVNILFSLLGWIEKPRSLFENHTLKINMSINVDCYIRQKYIICELKKITADINIKSTWVESKHRPSIFVSIEDCTLKMKVKWLMKWLQKTTTD